MSKLGDWPYNKDRVVTKNTKANYYIKSEEERHAILYPLYLKD